MHGIIRLSTIFEELRCHPSCDCSERPVPCSCLPPSCWGSGILWPCMALAPCSGLRASMAPSCTNRESVVAHFRSVSNGNPPSTFMDGPRRPHMAHSRREQAMPDGSRRLCAIPFWPGNSGGLRRRMSLCGTFLRSSSFRPGVGWIPTSVQKPLASRFLVSPGCGRWILHAFPCWYPG